MTGKLLNHYRILHQLGKGGMGEVYAAEDTRLRRKVAVKMLPEEMASDPSRVERFQREAEAIAALNHPNIVTIYSVEQAENTHFLTMELVEGRNLTELIPPQGMDAEGFFKIAISIAEALAAARPNRRDEGARRRLVVRKERGSLLRVESPPVVALGCGRVRVPHGELDVLEVGSVLQSIGDKRCTHTMGAEARCLA